MTKPRSPAPRRKEPPRPLAPLFQIGPTTVLDPTAVLSAYVNKDDRLIIWISPYKAFSLERKDLFAGYELTIEAILEARNLACETLP